MPKKLSLTKRILPGLLLALLVIHTPSAFAEPQQPIEAATQETRETEESEESQETQDSQGTEETETPQTNGGFTPPPAPPFSDVTEKDTRFVPINYLREQGLIQGYEDGTFRPEQPINRAEALKMLTLAIQGNKTKNPADFSFSDVPEGEWFYGYVEQAWNNYLVKGYPDGLFHPEQPINLAESLKIVLLQEGDSIPVTVSESPYSDVSSGDWFAPYAAVAKERTLWPPSRDGAKLYGGKTMNRGDFAELIYKVLKSKDGSRFGRATWYGSQGVNWGTASGERFNTNKMAAAHKTLPFGTQVKVTNTANGKSVTVVINDRGPYATGMEIDLTSGAFQKIGSLGTGIVMVEYKVITDEEIMKETLNNLEYSF